MKILMYLLPLLLAVLSACKHNGDSPAHDHAHDAKLQLTSYGTYFEVFAEADPFAIGKNSSILAHFTWLNNFKPLHDGAVTLSLIVGNKGIRQAHEHPTKPGIYAFTIQPQTAGEGKLVFTIKTNKGESEELVSHIRVYADKHEAEHAAENEMDLNANTVQFTKEQSWKVDFATEKPSIEPFGQIIKTLAQIQSAQGDEIIVSAKTNGMLSFSDNLVLEGIKVVKGQTLFSISGSGLDNASNVRFAEAGNNFAKAQADYERMIELARDKIVSEKDLLNAKNQYENAKAVFENINKSMNAQGQEISSPMTGFIKQTLVKNGQYIEAGQALAIISQNKSLVLRAEVRKKFARYLSNIISANIRTLHDNQTYTLEQLNGKVLAYGRSANIDNHLLPVSLQIDNPGTFVSGGFVELYLKTLTNSQALTIPNTALLESQGVYFVFVQLHPELFEKREVKTGVTDGIKTEIIEGITENDRIVTKGAILIKLAQASVALDAHAGHHH